MNIEFLSTVTVIAPAPPVSRKLYVDAWAAGSRVTADEYHQSEQLAGCKSFEAPQWWTDRPVPQVSIGFDVADAAALGPAARELEQAGHELLQPPREEPWVKRSPGCSHRRARSSGSRAPLYYDQH